MRSASPAAPGLGRPGPGRLLGLGLFLCVACAHGGPRVAAQNPADSEAHGDSVRRPATPGLGEDDGRGAAAGEEGAGVVSRAEFEAWKREVEELRRQGLGLGGAGAAQVDGSAGRFPVEQGGVYDKPFLRSSSGPRVHLSGYFDVEFRDAAHADHELRFHRLVPLIYADLHERIKFASEIEIEDGSEVEVEFAHLDLLLWRQANLRAGVILDPLGRFNLHHDSPINDLTDRPLVDQFVIPTTLREVGAGLFGSILPEDSSIDVRYEAYLGSGFKGLSDDPAEPPAISRSEGLREARPHEETFGTRRFGDNNNGFSGVGRLSVSPSLGTELGASAHHGTYDSGGRNDLTITALDAQFTLPQLELCDVPVGPIEVLAEGAYAFIERDAFARAQGVPDDFWGYYVQVNWHFLPESLLPEGTRLTTAAFPESVFTLVGRWDQIDLDGARRYRFTLGLNFRPIEATVFKLDYQLNRGTGAAPQRADDDAFLISVASYF